MKFPTETSSITAARLLGEWSRLTSTIYSTAKFEVEPSSSIVSCAVLLPNKEKLRVQAESVEDAAIRLSAAIQAQLPAARCRSHWAPEWQELLDATKVSRKSKEAVMEYPDSESGNPIRTKERQETIGVTSKRSLYDSLAQIADMEGKQISIIARSLVCDGFEDLENRMFRENPRRLLDEFEQKLDELRGAETTQWMLRVSRHDSLRLKFTAKEYGKSVSRLAAMCLNGALQSKYASFFAIPMEEIQAANAAILLAKGPAIRTIAEDIGLKKEHSPLLSGILSGRIDAPKKISELLANALHVSERALMRVAHDAFRRSEVPSYKAESGKPTVLTQPESWDAAVKSLGLSIDDTQRLLRIED